MLAYVKDTISIQVFHAAAVQTISVKRLCVIYSRIVLQTVLWYYVKYQSFKRCLSVMIMINFII